MKTDAERMALIRQRTAQLQRQARARQMLLIDAGCMAACLALVVCLGHARLGRHIGRAACFPHRHRRDAE